MPLTRDQKQKLVDLLLSVPAALTFEGRTVLLGDGLALALDRNQANARLDLAGIVQQLEHLHADNVLAALIENTIGYVHGTGAAGELEALLQVVRKREPSAQGDGALGHEGIAALKAYLDEVESECDAFGNGDIYIDRTSCHVKRSFSRTMMHESRMISDGSVKVEPLAHVLAREEKIVLVGEPGLGKTTSLVHLARETAKMALSNAPKRALIPVYVELKFYSGEERLESLIARRVNDVLCRRRLALAPTLRESAELLASWLTAPSTHFLLLLDGLNEVRPEYHVQVRGLLRGLLNYPHHFVISCRERDYDGSLQGWAPTFALQHLDADGVRRFLSHALGEPGTRLFDTKIRHDERLLALASNPLMLTMMKDLARQADEVDLPASRGRLLRVLVSNMPQIRAGEGMRHLVPHDVVANALSQLGFEMIERGMVTAELREVRTFNLPTQRWHLEDVLAQAKDWRYLESDATLGGPVEFIHQLFLEYFAAAYLDDRLRMGESPAEVLGRRAFDIRWAEALMMLGGLVKNPTEALRCIAANTVSHQEWEASVLLSFWTEDNLQDPEASKSVVDAFVSALKLAQAVEIPSEWSCDLGDTPAEALGNLGDARAVVPLIAALHGEDGDVRFYAAEALGKLSDHQAVEPLILALSDDYRVEYGRDYLPSVGGAAAYALGELGDPRAVGPLLQFLDLDNFFDEDTSFALAGLGRLCGALPSPDPKIVNVLGTVVVDNDSFDVRESAIYALACTGTWRARAFLASLQEDQDEEIRKCASEALGRMKAARLMPLDELLNELHDADPGTRRIAVIELGEVGDPQAIPSLEQLAQEDSGRTARGSVAEAARETLKKIRQLRFRQFR